MVIVFRVCVELIGVVQDRPVQSPPFISKGNLLRKAFRYPTDIDFRSNPTPQTLIFAVILPHTSIYGVCHCLIFGSEDIARSNATSSDKTLTLFSANLAFRVLLCNENRREIFSKIKINQNFDAADDRRLAALLVKQRIVPIRTKASD